MLMLFGVVCLIFSFIYAPLSFSIARSRSSHSVIELGAAHHVNIFLENFAPKSFFFVHHRRYRNGREKRKIKKTKKFISCGCVLLVCVMFYLFYFCVTLYDKPRDNECSNQCFFFRSLPAYIFCCFKAFKIYQRDNDFPRRKKNVFH